MAVGGDILKNVQTIIDLDKIVLGQVVTINKNKFLNLGFENENGDIYMVSIPGVMVKKVRKGDKVDGEGGVRHSGFQTTSVEDSSNTEIGKDDKGSDEGEDQGTATE